MAHVEHTKKYLQVFAAKKGRSRTYTVEIHGQGYSAKDLAKLFDVLETTQDDDMLMTFPVIRELEDPKLMARLDKSIADIESGKVKTIPWEEVKRQLLAKYPKKKAKKGTIKKKAAAKK